jgi:hypothetical protein
MNSQADQVLVYAYRLSGVPGDLGMPKLSRFKAERHVIASVFKGQVLEGTGEEVSRADLDEMGRFRRVATGWGDLS